MNLNANRTPRKQSLVMGTRLTDLSVVMLWVEWSDL
jgi:hypothetical protein